MALTESLTIRILGDSSSLRRELTQVADQIAELQDRLSQTADAGARIGTSFGNLSTALGPLQQVSRMLTRITQQARVLNQLPISLNVRPALNSLQRLMAAAQAAATALQSLTFKGALPPPQVPTIPGPRRMARGGLVTGPSGLDRVPAMLSSGEFVLSRSAVDTWGTSFLDALNSHSRIFISTPSIGPGEVQTAVTRTPALAPAPPEAPRTPPLLPPQPEPANSAGAFRASITSFPGRLETHTTNNHFGGVTIQVRETADVNAVIRDLRLQGIQLRNRRG